MAESSRLRTEFRGERTCSMMPVPGDVFADGKSPAFEGQIMTMRGIGVHPRNIAQRLKADTVRSAKRYPSSA